MKAVVQRVSEAEVEVEGRVIARIGDGLLILLGVMAEDGPAEAQTLARKLAELRCFPDERGRMGRSLLEIGGEALVVSQVTLAADGRKGRRPSLDGAAPPERGRALYEAFVAALGAQGVPTRTGSFGAAMRVRLTNEGPVTFSLAV